jgi:hypothetical protein
MAFRASVIAVLDALDDVWATLQTTFPFDAAVRSRLYHVPLSLELLQAASSDAALVEGWHAGGDEATSSVTAAFTNTASRSVSSSGGALVLRRIAMPVRVERGCII